MTLAARINRLSVALLNRRMHDIAMISISVYILSFIYRILLQTGLPRMHGLRVYVHMPSVCVDIALRKNPMVAISAGCNTSESND